MLNSHPNIKKINFFVTVFVATGTISYAHIGLLKPCASQAFCFYLSFNGVNESDFKVS